MSKELLIERTKGFFICLIITILVYLVFCSCIFIYQKKVNNIDLNEDNIKSICLKDSNSSLCLTLPIIPILEKIPEKTVYIKFN